MLAEGIVDREWVSDNIDAMKEWAEGGVEEIEGAAGELLRMLAED
jgi:hypothetical protein